VPTYVVRVWIPDRPGALGAVASRIGAVRGDVVGIDILERGAGRAIDELYVELPDGDLVDLLVTEIKAVDGVAVEDVREADGVRDARLDALETAATLIACTSGEHLLDVLTKQAVADFGADWAAVLDDAAPVLRAAEGPAPEPLWLGAFVAGSSSSEAVASGESGPDDLAWAALATAGLHLVIGRSGRPLRSVERRQVAALARIADARWGELSAR
jgi:hypothetical protein